MRIIESVGIKTDLDPYLSLQALASYSGLSVRTLRNYLRGPCHIPHYKVNGKILVRKSDFDKWLLAFRVETNLDALVDGILEDLKKN